MTKKVLAITSAVLITLWLSVAQAAGKSSDEGTGAASNTMSQAKETLKQIEVRAAAAADEADHLRRLIKNSSTSPESKIVSLDVLKNDINTMGREISSLEAERGSLAAWEQQAVDKAVPLLKEAAANVGNAIKYWNDSGTHLWTEDFLGYAERAYLQSRQVATTLNDYLKYEKLRNQEGRLEENLGVGGN